MLTLEQVIERYPLPHPLGGVMTLEQMQKEDIVKAATWRRALLDLPVGYGKTILATCISLMLQPDVTIILVPPILIAQWVAWLNSIPGAGLALAYAGSPKQRAALPIEQADWLIMSYQVWNNDIAFLRKACAKADVLTVIDECFPAGTPVLTPCGQRPIEELQVGDKVLTSAGEMAILKTFQNLAFQLTRLELSDGSIISCTPDHPVFTDFGWLRAEDCAGRWVLPCAGVSDLQKGVQQADLRLVGGSDQADEVRHHLLEILYDEASAARESGVVQARRRKAGRAAQTRTAGARDSERSAIGGSSESCVGHTEGARVGTPDQERQWLRNDACRSPHSRCDGGSGLQMESAGFARQTPTWVSDQLQAGLRTPDCPGRLRAGWAQPQPGESKGSGQEEGGQVGRVRVVRVSGTELASPVNVFNLHVEGRHDYFAGGILVHNCQALKGRGVLFKNVRDFTSGGRDLIMMSGTIMSKPGDGYAYVKLNSPEVYASYAQFENIHVEERDVFKQPKKWHNLDLLQTNLGMRSVRRTKEEVHSALPKGRIIPVYYDLSKEHMALYKRLMEEQLLILDDGGKIDATTATRLYHAAQQIVVDFGHFAGDPEKRSAIFDLVDEVADEINLGGTTLIGESEVPASKLILWTTHRSVSRLIGAHMDARLAEIGKRGVLAYSEVDSKKSIKEFMEDPNTVCLTAQPGSAGAGLNPQYMCWEAAFVQIPTTTIPFIQSTGRIDRKGQRYPPNNRLFIARGTIQEQLLKNLMANDDLVNRAAGSKQGIRNLIFP